MKRYRWLNVLLLGLVLAACAPGADDMADDMSSDMSGAEELAEDTSAEMMADGFTLQLLHFADVDGGRDLIGNAPRFSALVEAFRSEMPESTLLLSSGDNWIPGPEYSVASDSALEEVLATPGAGRAHVAWLNALGVQASAIGNHELDLGPGDFAELIAPAPEGNEDGDTWGGAEFPYLSTNLDFSGDEDIAGIAAEGGQPADTLAGQVTGYVTAEVGGETVGIIGASTPRLNSITSTGGIVVSPESPDDLDALAGLIQEDVDALQAAGVNKIVLLAHMQSINIERTLAPLLSGVDIVVGGGSNSILADDNDRLRDGDTAVGFYPESYTGADGNPVLLVNTDGDYGYLGRLVVGFDEAGVIDASSLNTNVSGAYAADEQGLAEVGAAPIPEVQAIADALGSALQARAGNVLGYTGVYLNGERGSVRTEETNLGNLTADANLAYAQTVDPTTAISIKNGGGIRGPIGACIVPPGSTDVSDAVCGPPTGIPGISEAGAVSQLDLEIALRFNNGLTLVTVTGDQLKAIMENAVANYENVGGAFPQIAGMTLAFDPSQPAGSRVVSLAVADSNGAEAGGEAVTVVTDGEVVDAGTPFRAVTLGFLAEGGDDYPFPTDAAANVVNLEREGVQSGTFTFADDGSEQDALAEYLAANYGDLSAAFASDDIAEDTRIVNLAMQ